jgi:RHH-type proline utilization regulon transcriptional repressor/proline dehydrogenase/delta 1-pyrroline-5-carboxylate dehydrogenase
MIVDSSALTEQVVGDVLASAFDSAGQRCSALRVLCLQEDVADRTLKMLKGALAELRTGNPDQLRTDIGPVITAEARADILGHIETMRANGHAVTQPPMTPETRFGTFVPPTIIELRSLDELTHEVFGPVLHVVRFARENLDRLVDAINALGYGLTFGLHTRLDETMERVTARIHVGNIYVNRNIIGAVVGVQPFGGHGLSGTGPKAGGPLYMRRLLRTRPLAALARDGETNPILAAARFAQWLDSKGLRADAKRVAAQAEASPAGYRTELRGPVGEQNHYAIVPRGRIVAIAETDTGLFAQLGAILATGNAAVVMAPAALRDRLAGLPAVLAAEIEFASGWQEVSDIAGVLMEGDATAVLSACQAAAEREGPLVSVQGASAKGLADGSESYDLDLLCTEMSTSINTAAAGGNASLMTLSPT